MTSFMAAGTSEPDLAWTRYPSVWRDSEDSAEVTFSRKRPKLLAVATVARGRSSWFIEPLPAATLYSRRRTFEKVCCKFSWKGMKVQMTFWSFAHWPVRDEMNQWFWMGVLHKAALSQLWNEAPSEHFCFISIVNKLQGDLIESSSDEEPGLQEEQNSASVLDMEDLGTIMNRAKKAKVRLKWLSVILTRHSSCLQWWVSSGRSSGIDPGEQSGAGAAVAYR